MVGVDAEVRPYNYLSLHKPTSKMLGQGLNPCPNKEVKYKLNQMDFPLST
jgi:hypothetical protein